MSFIDLKKPAGHSLTLSLIMWLTEMESESEKLIVWAEYKGVRNILWVTSVNHMNTYAVLPLNLLRAFY